MTTTPIDNTSITTDFNVDELTEGTLTGKGVFDVLLQTLRLHLDREFNSGRITGTAYATVYSQAITAFLAQAAQYVINKAKLPLELQLLQEQINLAKEQQNKLIAETSLVDKQELQVIQETSNLVTANTKLNIEKDKLSYELNYIMPEEFKLLQKNQTKVNTEINRIANETLVSIKQAKLVEAQKDQVKSSTRQTDYITDSRLPQEVLQVTAQINEINYRVSTLLPSQTAQNAAQTAQITYTTSSVLPSQVAVNEAQTALYEQKTVTETAQAVSTPASGSVMGVQNDLMNTQKASYLRDAEQKAAKMLIDTWNVRRNADPTSNPVSATNRLRDEDIGSAVDKMLDGIGVV